MLQPALLVLTSTAILISAPYPDCGIKAQSSLRNTCSFTTWRSARSGASESIANPSLRRVERRTVAGKAFRRGGVMIETAFAALLRRGDLISSTPLYRLAPAIAEKQQALNVSYSAPMMSLLRREDLTMWQHVFEGLIGAHSV